MRIAAHPFDLGARIAVTPKNLHEVMQELPGGSEHCILKSRFFTILGLA
jgi:hypothetical protein